MHVFITKRRNKAAGAPPFAIAVMLAATAVADRPAQAQTQTQPPAPALWEEHVLRGPDGTFESCAAARNDEDGATMILDASADGQLYVILAYPGLSAPKISTTSVDVTVDDGLSYRLPASDIPNGFVVDLKNNHLMRTLLSNGKWVDFRGAETLRYALDGVGAALTAISNCRDHFAGAALSPPPAPAPVAAPTAPIPAATVAPAHPSRARYVAELDTYVHAAMAMEDWADLKKAFRPRLDGYNPVLTPRRRARDGRQFLIMTVPGFDTKAAVAKFCEDFERRRRRCVALSADDAAR